MWFVCGPALYDTANGSVDPLVTGRASELGCSRGAGLKNLVVQMLRTARSQSAEYGHPPYWYRPIASPSAVPAILARRSTRGSSPWRRRYLVVGLTMWPTW